MTTYDSNGDPIFPIGMSYDERDRLLSISTPVGTLSYSYDDAGNLCRVTTIDKTILLRAA